MNFAPSIRSRKTAGPTLAPLTLSAANLALAGQVTVSVVEKGNVVQAYRTQPNLILDAGMDLVQSNTWQGLMAYCAAGTGTTPTKDILNGTWSQTGTTIVSSGSTYTLTSADIGKWIGFASGESAKITAIISTTSATVATSQTVASGTATLFRAGQTGLATEIARSNTYPSFTAADGNSSQGFIPDASAQKMRVRRTFDFPAETSAQNYTEIGVSPTSSAGNNLFARVLLAGAVSVGVGQQLRVQYDLVIQLANIATNPETTLSITGWPVNFNIASITANGTAWTVTTMTAHNYATGGKVNIAGALPPKTAVIAATSTGTDFTITTGANHGRSVGDSITLEDMVPAAYNGEWTVASTPTSTTLTVTTTANPGTGTAFGTVRLATPVSWYNGEWTVASTPTSTTFTITNALNPGSAGQSGTVFNNTKAKFYPQWWGIGIYYDSGTGNAGAWLEMTSSLGVHSCTDGLRSPPGFTNSAASFLPRVAPTSVTKTAYVNGTWYQDHVSTFSTATLNVTNLRTLVICAGNNLSFAGNTACPPSCWIILNEPQVKESTNTLVFTVRRQWTRVLS